MFVTTLIATGRLDKHDLSAALNAMNSLCAIQSQDWLDYDAVVDISFREEPDWARGVLDSYFADCSDIVIQPLANREKRLLVADMDSTMITVECIDELADYAGIKPEIAAITEAAMRGELDFAGALDARVALLAGLDAGVIDRCLAERVVHMPGARTLIQTMRARGARCVLVSGGFTRFAEPVAAALGFDQAIANKLLIDGGKLTGAVAKPIVDAGTKLATLQAEAAALGIGLERTLAVGDGANDLPMIRAASDGGGLGVAYRAKPVVAAAAGVRVEHGDLTALLWAQGIPRADWVTD